VCTCLPHHPPSPPDAHLHITRPPNLPCLRIDTDCLLPLQVRLEFLRVVGNWMLRLRERTDHEGRLLPFVLAALVDETQAVSEAAAALLDELGAQYEREHESEVQELQAYAPEEARGPAAAPAAAAAPQLASSLAAGALAAPRLGVRLLVQSNVRRLLVPLCADLSSWQAAPRERWVDRQGIAGMAAITRAAGGPCGCHVLQSLSEAAAVHPPPRSLALLEAVLLLVGPRLEDQLQLLIPALVRVGPPGRDLPWALGGGKAGCMQGASAAAAVLHHTALTPPPGDA
jgi:hypothetical protein